VHSSVKNDALSLEVIKRLGFAVTSEGERGTHGIRALAGLSFIALMALSVFTGFTALLFQALVLARVGPVWIEAFPVPTETLGLFTWSWSTAAFYLAAILGALTIRYSRINRREWFDINNLSRERPILLYITPTLVGTAVGWLTLTIIALIGGPAFKVTFGELTVALGQVLRQSLPWLPLATMMSFIAVALSDSRTSDEPFWRGAFGRAACAASAMAVVGFLTGGLSIWTGITAFANKSQPALDISSAVIWTGLWLSLFIAFSIGLFVFVLCLVAQFAERKTGKNLSLAGKAVGATARQQPVFSIVFDETRTASLFDPTQVDLRPAFALCQGEWQLFPEGTAVRWESQPNQDCPYAGSFGLISSYGDSLIYEGFAGRFSGKADFVAQVHERLNGASGAAQVREARRDPREEAMPSTTNPPVERFASVSLNREGVA
jgi:hypothetical protein